MAPGMVGLDAFINCDTEGITICLTDQLHLVDAGAVNQGGMDPDGQGNVIEQAEGPEQLAGLGLAGNAPELDPIMGNGLDVPGMVGEEAAALPVEEPGGTGGRVASESRRG